MSSKPIPLSLSVLVALLVIGFAFTLRALGEPLSSRSTPGVTVVADGVVSLPAGEELVLMQTSKPNYIWTVTFDGESIITMHSDTIIQFGELDKRVYVPQGQYVRVVFGPLIDNLVVNIADDGTAHIRYPTKFLSDWEYIPAYD